MIFILVLPRTLKIYFFGSGWLEKSFFGVLVAPWAPKRPKSGPKGGVPGGSANQLFEFFFFRGRPLAPKALRDGLGTQIWCPQPSFWTLPGLILVVWRRIWTRFVFCFFPSLRHRSIVPSSLVCSFVGLFLLFCLVLFGLVSLLRRCFAFAVFARFVAHVFLCALVRSFFPSLVCRLARSLARARWRGMPQATIYIYIYISEVRGS